MKTTQKYRILIQTIVTKCQRIRLYTYEKLWPTNNYDNDQQNLKPNSVFTNRRMCELVTCLCCGCSAIRPSRVQARVNIGDFLKRLMKIISTRIATQSSSPKYTAGRVFSYWDSKYTSRINYMYTGINWCQLKGQLSQLKIWSKHDDFKRLRLQLPRSVAC